MTTTTHHIESTRLPTIGSQYLLAGILTAWAGLTAWFGYTGVYNLSTGETALPTLLAIAVPVGLFAVATAASGRFRAWVLGLDPVLLTEMQAWRILGGTFLVVYALGQLPGLFAWPAGLGDVAVGLAAPFVVWRLRRDPEFLSSARFRRFHYAGLFDFAVAVITGIAARNSIPGMVEGVTSSVMGQLPLVMIPTLLVPSFIILHTIVLMQSFTQKAAR